jgi:hypothetical protein
MANFQEAYEKAKMLLAEGKPVFAVAYDPWNREERKKPLVERFRYQIKTLAKGCNGPVKFREMGNNIGPLWRLVDVFVDAEGNEL